MNATQNTAAAPNPRLTAEQLRIWRERMGYTPMDACIALDCKMTDLSDWESGKPIPRYIGLACAALALGISGYGEKEG